MICKYWGCSQLKSIAFLGAEPPVYINSVSGSTALEDAGIFVDPFGVEPSSTIIPNVTIYVPAGSEDAYKNDLDWGVVKNIDTAIENVALSNADSGNKNIFDINGRKLSSLKSGINIVVNSNGKIKKIIR